MKLSITHILIIIVAVSLLINMVISRQVKESQEQFTGSVNDAIDELQYLVDNLDRKLENKIRVLDDYRLSQPAGVNNIEADEGEVYWGAISQLKERIEIIENLVDSLDKMNPQDDINLEHITTVEDFHSLVEDSLSQASSFEINDRLEELFVELDDLSFDSKCSDTFCKFVLSSTSLNSISKAKNFIAKDKMWANSRMYSERSDDGTTINIYAERLD